MNLGGLLSLDIWSFTPATWGLFFASVFIVGFSKTGLPGITILAVPLMAMVVPPKLSVGILLPVYMLADIASLFTYWRHARWSYCFPYLFFVAIGVACAALIVNRMTDDNFGALIGWAVLFILTVGSITDYVRNGKEPEELPPVPKPSLAASAFFGTSVGLFSAMANAAGPLVSLYLIRARLPKYEFLGTTAFCAFIMNWIKVPLFLKIGIINAQTLKLDIAAIPVIVLGCGIGIFAARKIPQKAFKTLVLLLAFAASVKLALG